MKYKELEEQRKQKAGELKALLDKHKNDAGDYDMDKTVLTEVKSRHDELNKIGEQADQARELAAIEAKAVDAARLPNPQADPTHPKGGREEPGTTPIKTLGELFTESEAYTGRKNPQGFSEFQASLKNLDIKTLMTTAAGFAPANNRGPVVLPFPLRRPMIADLIPSDSTEVQVVKYMEQTTFDNQAAPVLEGAAKPQSGLAFVERNALVQKIATWLPVTDEQLKYVPQIKALIDNNLTKMLQLKEEDQLLTGNGTSPNLQGFLTKTGIQTRAKAAGVNIADAVYMAFTDVRVANYAEPSGVVIHPTNWQDVRLMKTTQGEYIYGNPSEAGPERFWGKPAIITTAITLHTLLTGDFAMYSHISRAMEIMIEVGYQNDDFIKNLKTIRAEEYLSLEIYYPAAFEKVTALNS